MGDNAIAAEQNVKKAPQAPAIRAPEEQEESPNLKDPLKSEEMEDPLAAAAPATSEAPAARRSKG